MLRTDSTDNNILCILNETQDFGTISDFYNINSSTLLQWWQRLTATGFVDSLSDLDVSSQNRNNEDDDQHQLSLEIIESSNSLFSIADHKQSEIDSMILEWIDRVGSNPTETSITELIQKTLSLNQKQFLIVKKILNHAIQQHGKTAVDAQNQMLLCVADEGEMEKTQIIKAIKLEYKLLKWKNEVLLLTLTGTAAYNIDRHIIHNDLCINLSKHSQKNISLYTYFLWKEKDIMIIDKISMISLTLLNIIN